MTRDDEAPVRVDDGPALLVGSSDAAFERLLRAGEGPLVAVACGGRSDQLLRRAAGLDVPVDVALFDVGGRTRSAADGESGRKGEAPLLTAVPRSDLCCLGALVDDTLADLPGAGSVYVDGEGLVSTVGVGDAYRVFEQLRRRHRPAGTTVYGSLPETARETTVAGLAPLFDVVATVGDDGELQPRGPRADGDALSVERRLDLLRPRRRRLLLRALDDVDGRASVDRLADAVAEGDAAAEDRRILLYQSDLPKLDANGVVDFDREARTAALTPAALQLWPLLETTDRW